MNAMARAAFTRHAKFTRDRRATFKVLGASAFVAAVPGMAAGKKGKKCKKAKFSEEKCNRQSEYCQEALEGYCGSSTSCYAALSPCCESCLTGPAVTCIMAALPPL